MELFRYASSVYGQPVLLGASWDLLGWFVASGAVFIFVHAAYKAITGATSRQIRGGDRIG
jgi:hypothetical protein